MTLGCKGRLVPALFFSAALLAPGCGSAPPPPSTTSTAAQQVQWDEIRSWSGRGDQQLDSFPSEGGLRIEWEAVRVPDSAAAPFLRVVIHSAISGRPLSAPVVDHQGEGKGTAFVAEEPRVFFANVESDGVDWTITISERVR